MAQATQATVGELVVERPSRARVFEKLGIDYCCGGKKPLEAACREKGLDVKDVVARMDQEPIQNQDRNWATASMTDLCDHIEQTHHAYLREELPRLEFLTGKVANRHGPNHPEQRQVHEVFMGLKSELEMHMMKEERVLFPLCRELDTAEKPVHAHCGSVANPIEVMVREHDDAGQALEKLRALTNDYTCPPDGCNTFRAMYDSLRQLEEDLHQHIHKENNILFPKAVRVEKMVNRT